MSRLVGEEGVLRTALQLTLRPGRVISDYLAGSTVRYVNPVGFLLVAVAAFTLIGREIVGPTGAAESDRIWAILIIPFVAAASRALHWRGPYNLAEHLILVTYLGGQVLVLLALSYFGLLLVPSRLESAYGVSVLAAGIVFYVWGYSQVFEKRRYIAALAGVLSLVLGSAVWLIGLVALVRLLSQ